MSEQDTNTTRFSPVSRSVTEIDALVAVIRRLSFARSIQEVMDTVVPAARKLLGADGITFVLRDGGHCYYADEDAISPLWKGKRFRLDACISGWCMIRRTAVAIRDIYADDRIPHDAYKPTFVQSLAMVPVRKEDPVAAMGAYWANEKIISDEELARLQTLADAASLAIAQATLQQEKDNAGQVRQESFHRIKNIFSVALAIVHQTSGSGSEEYRNTLDCRLRALEQAHAAIFEASEQGVDLGDLLGRILPAYAPSGSSQLHCRAAQICLSPSAAVDLGLVITELAMNATEHGAWSTSSGRVELDCDQKDNTLHLRWREFSGPPVRTPSETGFGLKLIRGLAQQNLGGQVDLKWLPDGLFCELEVPITPK